jgi:hypothetical protein
MLLITSYSKGTWDANREIQNLAFEVAHKKQNEKK